MEAYQLDIKTISKQFKTDVKNGLTQSKANKQLKKYGYNKFSESGKKPVLLILLQQFLSPLMFILLIAAIASILINEYSDAIVIGIAVLMNGAIGFFQEWKAEKAVTTLKSYEVPICMVRRDGKILSIEAKKLVPGDIVLLTAGSRVPADIRLFYTVDLRIEEALLTGESRAIAKDTNILHKALVLGDRTNIAYSGTYVINGKAEGIVIATGEKTELGKLAKLVIETKEELTPLQIQIKHFSWILGGLMLIITSGIFFLGLIKGIPFHQIITTSIALAVAAIPEGLLVAVTVVLAIGMQRMLKRKALVRHLIAAETLGSVSVICTDKTGTLTEGQMSVNQIITKNSDFALPNLKEIPKDVYEILITGCLNNDAQISADKKSQRIGHPTEVALLEAAHNANISIESIQKETPRIKEIPFSSELKYMATVHKIDTCERLIVKGAPEQVLTMCPQDENYFKIKSNEMTKKGLRVLAFAIKDLNSINLKKDLNKLECLGLVGIQDPLRPHTIDTINDLKNAGIRLILITGDHKETATNIAKGAGIPVRDKAIITGTELSNMSDKQLYNNIENIDVFARVNPKHKIRIVDAWQKKGKSVAMIGDGVNDAPALKSADIGVALGSGSDVAHEISDMVLLDNNLSTISAAVQAGRVIFDNIRKIIVYLMADSFSEIILIAGSLLLGLPLPILASQILWINLVTDGFPNIALTVEPGEPEIMLEKPRPKNTPVVNKEMKILIFLIGIITDLGLFALYLTLLFYSKFDLIHIRTIMFTALSIDSLFYVFSVRSMRTSIIRTNLFQNHWLIVAVIGGALIQLAVIYIPSLQILFQTVSLGLLEWGIILGLSVIKIIGIEITKDWFIHHKHQTS